MSNYVDSWKPTSSEIARKQILSGTDSYEVFVKSGIEGSTSGFVSVKSNGVLIKTEPVSVSVKESKTTEGQLSPGTNLFLGIGIAALAVIIVIIAVLHFTGGNGGSRSRRVERKPEVKGKPKSKPESKTNSEPKNEPKKGKGKKK